jgi:hypothetical protein
MRRSPGCRPEVAAALKRVSMALKRADQVDPVLRAMGVQARIRHPGDSRGPLPTETSLHSPRLTLRTAQGSNPSGGTSVSKLPRAGPRLAVAIQSFDVACPRLAGYCVLCRLAWE